MPVDLDCDLAPVRRTKDEVEPAAADEGVVYLDLRVDVDRPDAIDVGEHPFEERPLIGGLKARA